jgi:hypothetical protein
MAAFTLTATHFTPFAKVLFSIITFILYKMIITSYQAIVNDFTFEKIGTIKIINPLINTVGIAV